MTAYGCFRGGRIRPVCRAGASPVRNVSSRGDRLSSVSTRRSRYRPGEVRGFALYFFNAIRMRHSASSSDRYFDFRAPPRSATCLLAGNGPNRSRVGREFGSAPRTVGRDRGERARNARRAGERTQAQYAGRPVFCLVNFYPSGFLRDLR